MKCNVLAALTLVLVLVACVPEAEPYVPLVDDKDDAATISDEIKQLEEQGKEQARQKLEAEKPKEEPKPEPKPVPTPEVKVEQQPASLKLALYPYFFMDGDKFKSNFITVVGDEAASSYDVAMSNLIARSPGSKPTGFRMLASEIADISRYNAIVAGNPCNNPVISRMYGNPFPCEDANLPADKGRIRLVASANGNLALVAEGKTDALVVAALNIIGTPEFAGVGGSEVCVQGTSLVAC
jgi:hypothetical protein